MYYMYMYYYYYVVSVQELSLVSDEDIIITIVYDSMYCKDRHSRIEDQNIEILYKEHPQKVQHTVIITT